MPKTHRAIKAARRRDFISRKQSSQTAVVQNCGQKQKEKEARQNDKSKQSKIENADKPDSAIFVFLTLVEHK